MNYESMKSYNKHIIISNTFDNYRTYLYRIDDLEYFSNNYYKLIYVIKGQVSINIDNNILKLEQNNLYYIGSDVCYKLLGDREENTLLILDIKEDYLLGFRDSIKNNAIYNNQDYISKQEIVALMGELYLMTFNEDWNTFISDKKMEVLISAFSDSVKKSHKLIEVSLETDASVENTIYRITQSLNIAIKNQDDIEISLNEIAEKYSINYYYLSRQFKEVTGLNYTDYILNIKLNKAVNLLVNTDYKIIDISKSSDFKNVKSFNSHFRTRFDTTPTEFRREYRDFKNTLLKDRIHQEETTKLFFKEVLNEDIMYFKPIISNSHKIGLGDGKLASLDSWDTIIDLKDIIEMEEDFHQIESLLREEFISELILNIYLSHDSSYILMKNARRLRLSPNSFKYIIDQAYQSVGKIFIVFNVEEEGIENPKLYKEQLIRLLEITRSIIGHRNLGICRFGLNIGNIKSLVERGDYSRLKDYIAFHRNILCDSLERDYSWVLYLRDIENKGDVENYLNFIGQLEPEYLDEFLLEINYKGQKLGHGRSLDNYLEMIDSFVTKAEYKKKLLIGFNYDISSIELDKDLVFNYASLYSLNVYFKLRERGYQVGYINYVKDIHNRRFSLNKYSYNRLGIRTPEYYTASMVKSFASEIIRNENGLMVTREEEDLNIFLYDNIYELYQYLTSNLVVNISKSIEHNLDLRGLRGRYKIIEYSLSLIDGRVTIADEDIVNISEEDKRLLDYSNMPHVDINIREMTGKDSYKLNRNILDIKYVKFIKI